MRAGDTVAVFGCGPIGLTALRAARAAGAKEVFVSEPNDSRREVAHRLEALLDSDTEHVKILVEP